MSVDFTLKCDGCGSTIIDRNYTHNVAIMANTALDRREDEETYWRQLNGLSGTEGSVLLNKIIVVMEENPKNFRAMNPPNGWGNFDEFLGLLKELRDSVPANVMTTWECHG